MEWRNLVNVGYQSFTRLNFSRLFCRFSWTVLWPTSPQWYMILCICVPVVKLKRKRVRPILIIWIELKILSKHICCSDLDKAPKHIIIWFRNWCITFYKLYLISNKKYKSSNSQVGYLTKKWNHTTFFTIFIQLQLKISQH